MNNDQPNDNVDLFSQLFVASAQAIVHNLAIEELDLTPLQILTLMTVFTHPGTTMSHLADGIGVSSAQMSRTVRELESRGLVKRAHNPKNRRIVNVLRTEAGEAVAEQHMHTVQTRLAARLAGLDPTDRDQLTMNLSSAIDILAKVGIVKVDPKHGTPFFPPQDPLK